MTKRTQMISLQYEKTMGGSGKKNILDDSRIKTVKTESLSCLLYEHKWKLQRKMLVWESARLRFKSQFHHKHII